MTLLFIDSFDHYDSTEFTEKGYSSTSAGSWVIGTGKGRRGGACMDASPGIGINGSHLTQAFTASDTVVVGAAINFNVFADKNAMIFEDSIGGLHKFLTTSAGELKLTSGGVTVTSATAFHTVNTYSYYELKFIKGTGADATLQLKKDGVTVLTISTSTGVNQVSACRFLDSFVYDPLLDDLYILNGLGSVNNDYLGDVRVDAQLTNADGATNNFIPNTGAASFTHVDDPLPDADSTFVEAGTINSRDLYSVANATLGTVIHGVQQCVLNRKTDAGTVTIDLITEKPAGSGEKVTDTDTASDNYDYQLAILETDQDDSSTWTDAKVNATEFGYKINNIET